MSRVSSFMPPVVPAEPESDDELVSAEERRRRLGLPLARDMTLTAQRLIGERGGQRHLARRGPGRDPRRLPWLGLLLLRQQGAAADRGPAQRDHRSPTAAARSRPRTRDLRRVRRTVGTDARSVHDPRRQWSRRHHRPGRRSPALPRSRCGPGRAALRRASQAHRHESSASSTRRSSATKRPPTASPNGSSPTPSDWPRRSSPIPNGTIVPLAKPRATCCGSSSNRTRSPQPRRGELTDPAWTPGPSSRRQMPRRRRRRVPPGRPRTPKPRSRMTVN